MNNILAEIKKLTKKYHTNDPFELCDILEIELVQEYLPKGINGIYNSVLGFNFIYLEKSLCYSKKRAVLAHELGHYILHPDINSIFVKNKTLMNWAKLENEADIFAAFLLIPDKISAEELTINQLAYELQVPTQLIEKKISCIGA
ncbi:MAG: ImmA/IrrE family metallo-endopeptidase [Oscillospiraceae bacterium]